MYKIDLNQLIQGKETKIYNKQFNNTLYYIEPFLKKAEENNVKNYYIQVKMPNQVNTKFGKVDEDNMTFNKVLIHAELPSNNDEYAPYVGITYALDVKEPVIKMYKGIIHKSTNNTFAFNPNNINIQFLKNNIDYSPLDKFFINEELDYSMFNEFKNQVYTYRDIKYQLGKWVSSCMHTQMQTEAGTVMVPAEMPVAVFKNLYFNNNSTNYVDKQETIDKNHLYHTYSSICLNNNRDIINVFEKNIIINDILKS